MKSISNTYRFIAFTLAFLMFFSSASFAVDMHYCQGKLKTVNFFGKAKSCHERVETASTMNCPHHQKMMKQYEGCSEEKNCCSNKTFYFQSGENQQIQAFDIVIDKELQQFIVAYRTVFFHEGFSVKRDITASTHYKPPLISRDIPVLFESFLL